MRGNANYARHSRARESKYHQVVNQLDGENGLGRALPGERPQRRLVRHPRLDGPLRPTTLPCPEFVHG